MIAMTSLVVLFYVDGLHAYTTHRRVQVIQTDGSSISSGYKLLQSDVTTLISFLASLSRIVGAWWAGDIAWRCVFLFMEKGGISLQGVNRMFGGFLKIPSHSTLCNQLVFLVILGATFSSNFYSSIISGSIAWKPGYTLSQGSKPLGNIARGAAGNSLRDYLVYSEWPTQVKLSSTVIANTAWGGDGANSTSMKRVLPNTQMLSLGSVLTNITVPYFAVDDFEWIRDPESVLTKAQLTLAWAVGDPFCPFFSSRGHLGLLPDQQWGPFKENNSYSMREPHVENRTHILVVRTKFSLPDAAGQGCDSDDHSGIPQAGRYHIHSQDSDECLVFAWLRVRAGVALCRNCPITLPNVVEHDGNQPLQLAPDSLTSQALAMASIVSTWMIFANYGVPTLDTFPDPQHRAVEHLSRSYQAAWNSITERFGIEKDATELQIAVTTSRAFVQKWRLWLWIILHFVVLVIGLCFTAWHMVHFRQPWMENPAFAAFCLDTNVIGEKLRDMNIDPWLPEPALPGLILRLENASSSARCVVEMTDPVNQELE